MIGALLWDLAKLVGSLVVIIVLVRVAFRLLKYVVVDTCADVRRWRVRRRTARMTPDRIAARRRGA